MAETTQIRTPFGQFVCFENDLITFQLREFGAHQRSDLAILLSLIEPGDVILDIGAHIGTFAVPLAKRVGPNGRVYAFEAIPEHYQLLSQNAKLNGVEETLIASNAIVTRGMAAPRGTPYSGNTGAMKLGESGEIDLHEVPQMTLDDWWESAIPPRPCVNIVKIDVEGMEADVLLSGGDMTRREKPVIVFEVGGHDIEGDPLREMNEFFADRDYQLFINLHERNVSEDKFRIGRLKSLNWSRLIGLADVLAVPRESQRYPSKFTSAPLTQAILLGHAVLRLPGAVASRLRGRDQAD